MANLAPKIVIFDIETRLSPDVTGWEAARKGQAGISAIVLYDSTTNWLYMYDDHSIDEAIHHLESADLVISYNGDSFDIPAIEGYAHKTIRFKRHWDMYSAFKRALGKSKIKGIGLGPTAERTIGLSKSGHGSDAPALAAAGRFGDLFRYCASDVFVLKSLLEYIIEHGHLIAPDGTHIRISLPPILKATKPHAL